MSIEKTELSSKRKFKMGQASQENHDYIRFVAIRLSTSKVTRYFSRKIQLQDIEKTSSGFSTL